MMKSNQLTALREQLVEELNKEPIDFRVIAELNKQIQQCDQSGLRFSVDARHIHRLGFELVGRQETALSELIKNAYDADATEVTIQFNRFEKPGGELVISDDGSGMSLDAIRNTWMRLSTSEKENSPISDKFKRSRAGRKGIGRFAVERLGKKLVLETQIAGIEEGIRVEFEWDEKFRPDVDIGLLVFDVELFAKPIDVHGTKLIISPLRDRWTESQLKSVWKSVILLQPPFKVRRTYRGTDTEVDNGNDPGFSVVINGKSSEEKRSEFSLDKTFLDQRTARISGSIDDKGVAHFKFDSEKLGVSEETVAEKRLLLVGEVTFEADYFIYAPELIAGFSVRTAQEVGAQYGGIRIYRDGFRVLPYGEERNDWLRLDHDTGRRTLLVPARNTNFFGQVELSSIENELLEETSSREGLIENEAFLELTDFLRLGIEWAVLRIAAYRERKQTAGQKGFVSNKKLPTEQIADIFDSIPISLEKAPSASANSIPAEAFTAVKIEVEKVVQSFQEEQAERERAHLRYEELLRILASLGTSIAVFSHEIRGALNGFAGSVLTVRSLLEKTELSPEAEKSLGEVDSRLGQLGDLGSYVISLIAHTARRQKAEIPLHSAIGEFASQFRHYLDSRRVEFDVDVHPPYLRTAQMHRSEIDSVLFNFLTNSIKAMDRANVDSRRIKISATKEGKYAKISFQDNGTGVDLSIRDKIFEAFFTTQQYGDGDLAGPGSGLGLKIVSDIASANGGRVELGMPESTFNCRFDFFVPIAEGQH